MIDELEAIEAARCFVKAESYHERAKYWLRHALCAGGFGIIAAYFVLEAGSVLLTICAACSLASSACSRKACAELETAKKLHAKAIEP